MATTVTRTFIENLYTNVLQRNGETSGIDHWVAQTDAGMSAPDVTTSFINSPEAQRVESILHLYNAFFNRAADSGGLRNWVNALNSGTSLLDIAKSFSASSEFQARIAGVSTADRVEAIYSNLFNRASDPAGKAYWIQKIDSGALSLAEVSLAFTLSPEALANTGAATRFTESYLLLRASGTVEPSTAVVEALATDTLATALAEIITNFDLPPDAATAAAAAAAVTAATAAAAAVAAAAAAAAAAPAEAAATVYTLTTNADHFTGTPANDTFVGTYDGGVSTDTFGFGGNDVLNGSGGSADTLLINHLIDVAITPPDALWTGISNVEKIVINTTGNGAQSIITGTAFQAAFATAGVALTTITSGSGAITIDMSSFTGAETLTTTSLAGAQTILTGSGVATVNAKSVDGALTIQGAGLVSVTGKTTGAGAQTIGDSGGGGAHLVTVNATSNSGAQTITSTSTSDATVIAISTSGLQTIITGAGNDTVTTTSAVGTSNSISTGAGNDTVVASLGNDLITGGLGSDTMTGGGGINTFAIGANGSVIGTSRDIITDFKPSDFLTFGGASTALLAADATALVAGSGAGSNVQNTAGGLITFAAGDNTLALKVAAVQADVQLDVAGTVAMFVDGGNTYLYYASAAGNADDQLIQLTGITTLTTITGGATTQILS